MEFSLHYRGLLKANAGPAEKHRLRQHFHVQLAQLWGQLPLKNYPKLLDPARPPGDLSVLRNLGPFLFAPLVAERLHMVAELGITMLRPEPPGRIVTQAGDIDNRLKTLLDSLKMPGEPGELPPGAAPSTNETPFFCLLEDDNLITALTVRSDRLLERVESPGELELTVHVTTKLLATLIGNIGLG
jgi:hypothetical protein